MTGKKEIDMLDKDLFLLAKGSGRYIAATVVFSVVAMLLNMAVPACIFPFIALAA